LVDTTIIEVKTGGAARTLDLTSRLDAFVSGRGDGLLSVFAPHATAGLAVMETGAGSDADLMDHLDTVFPRDDRWSHRHGSPGHGADHVIPAFVSPSVVVPVVGGRMALGTWQSVVLIDPNRDNRTRQVRLSFLPS
jgi:secondary thiamine-phosphate synthase enzyme